MCICLIGFVPVLRMTQPSAAHAQTYEVLGEDTLSAIALRFHVSTLRLARLNGLADPNRLRAGQILTVPDGAAGGWEDSDHAEQPTPANQAPTTASGLPQTATSYVVVRGDTLAALSSRLGIPLAALASANGISHPDLHRIGALN